VLIDHQAVLFVHGCFWHRHPRCKYAYVPKSRTDFWQRKFDANVRRDRKVKKLLRSMGWKVIIVWECQLRQPERLVRRLSNLFGKEGGRNDA
jgi:DNA mismatch endonuclease, patch repair protein